MIFKAMGMLTATGFRRLVSTIKHEEQQSLITTLTNYHCLLKVKSKMDQFLEGLDSLGIHQGIKNQPDVLQRLFVPVLIILQLVSLIIYFFTVVILLWIN